MENSNFETGASNARINNFILTLDSTREAREKLIPVLQEVFIEKETANTIYLNQLIYAKLKGINGTLHNAEKLTLSELREAANLYRLEAINATENDLF